MGQLDHETVVIILGSCSKETILAVEEVLQQLLCATQPLATAKQPAGPPCDEFVGARSGYGASGKSPVGRTRGWRHLPRYGLTPGGSTGR
jgi:hypothetical protein